MLENLFGKGLDCHGDEHGGAQRGEGPAVEDDAFDGAREGDSEEQGLHDARAEDDGEDVEVAFHIACWLEGVFGVGVVEAVAAGLLGVTAGGVLFVLVGGTGLADGLAGFEGLESLEVVGVDVACHRDERD